MYQFCCFFYQTFVFILNVERIKEKHTQHEGKNGLLYTGFTKMQVFDNLTIWRVRERLVDLAHWVKVLDLELHRQGINQTL